MSAFTVAPLLARARSERPLPAQSNETCFRPEAAVRDPCSESPD